MKKLPPLTASQKAQILGDKPLAFSAFRKQPPRALISACDMFQILLADAFQRWFEIKKIASEYEVAAHDTSLRTVPIDQTRHQQLRQIVSNFQFICFQFELTETSNQVHLFEHTIKHDSVDWVSINNLMHHLLATLQKEMGQRLFMRIPQGNEEYFENDELFGQSVALAFPEAKAEIKDAGNCLAADLYTAAVFHLMRASEFGLRALAKKLNAWQRQSPVEFAQWGDVIEDIKKEIEKRELKIKNAPRGHERDAALEDCRVSLADLSHFKMDRDRVMHTRADYDGNEARGVFRRVSEFMNRLEKTNFGETEADYQI